MPYKIPYSNFHELNLDWLLEQVKLLRTDVDDMMGAATPSDEPPMANGTANAGTSVNYSRGDHVHPTDTSRAAASALTTETIDRQDADLLLSGRIDTLSARVVPSDAYPLMDGAAESGSNVEYSRRDHRHPTDTSRAAASDLTQEITDRGNADITLQTNIDTVDAKIKFSSTAPLMDSSSASPGFSDYLARADHVHPTDTSRASQDDFDTLKARVDAFSGSANPSDTTPNMDGVGSAGTGGNYSRGDHVHPSDTSKLNVAGGTITGDLDIDGYFVENLKQRTFTLTNTGWYRVIECPVVYGTHLDIFISKSAGDSLAEVHKLSLMVANTGILFCDERSKGPASVLIDRIRYTDAGMIDIHYNNNETNNLMVKIRTCAPTEAQDAAIKMHTVEAVADAPLGEVVYYNYYFRPNVSNCIITLSFTRIENNWYSAADVGLMAGYMANNIYYLIINLRNSLAAIPTGVGVLTPIARVNVPNGYSLIGMDQVVAIQAGGPADLLVDIAADGTISVFNGTSNAVGANSFARAAIAVPIYNS